MKKICIKIFIIALLVIIFINNFSYGITTGFGEIDIKGTTTSIPTREVNSILNNIVNIVSLVGSGISVIALIVLGIKYMSGSLEERADYKKTLLPYIIGAIILFSGTLVPKILYDIFK